MFFMMQFSLRQERAADNDLIFGEHRHALYDVSGGIASISEASSLLVGVISGDIAARRESYALGDCGRNFAVNNNVIAIPTFAERAGKLCATLLVGAANMIPLLAAIGVHFQPKKLFTVFRQTIHDLPKDRFCQPNLGSY